MTLNQYLQMFEKNVGISKSIFKKHTIEKYDANKKSNTFSNSIKNKNPLTIHKNISYIPSLCIIVAITYCNVSE